MGDLVYLDTSALMRWAAKIGGSPNDRDTRGHVKLEALVAGPDQLGASPVTIAEFSSQLHDHVRNNQGWEAGFTEAHADTCEEQLMRWLADGTIHIRQLGTRAFEVGLSYIAGVTRQHGRKLRAWDAIHLYEATRWSRQAGVPVTLATSDDDFGKFIGVFPEFAAHVVPLDTTA